MQLSILDLLLPDGLMTIKHSNLTVAVTVLPGPSSGT